MRCFIGLRQVTDPRLLQQAHQKSGSFPRPALPGFSSTMTLSDSHLCRRLSAPLRPLPSPKMGLPRLPASPFRRAVPTTPADRDGCMCRLLPRSRGLPRYVGGSASAPLLSRPAQASLTLRPAGLLNPLLCHSTRSRAEPWAASPKAAFVTRLRPSRLPDQTARQLPEQSTTLWVEPSSTGDPRHRGALHKSRPLASTRSS